MPAIPIQGGGFQDCLGNPVAGGRLVMILNQQAMDTLSGAILICPGQEIVYALNTSGDIDTTSTPKIWANAALSPNTTYYMARVYTKGGQLAWGPNAVYATVTSGVVDISDWTPNNPV